jgi:hypothetical protein
VYSFLWLIGMAVAGFFKASTMYVVDDFLAPLDPSDTKQGGLRPQQK